MRRFLYFLVFAVVLAAAGALYLRQNAQTDGPAFRFATVERGDLQMIVSSTGQINPVVTVQVGTQVSGQISALLADFNTPVKANQIIARIDPSSFQARVATARAELLVANANVTMQRASLSELRAELSGSRAAHKDAEQELGRKQALLKRRVVADAIVEKAIAARDQATAKLAVIEAKLLKQQAQLESAGAQVQARQATLDDRLLDLENTIIRSPVDGVVINRDVNLGQTVAASLQAPVLFDIAQDLGQMLIEVSVDEADIGRVRVGQRVNFSVDAYPQRKFTGDVQQIRQSPKIVSNVVTYTVISTAANPDYALLPGMTANIEIVIGARQNILKVASAALRFHPPGAEAARQSGDGGGMGGGGGGGGGGPEAARERAAALIKRLTETLALSADQHTGVGEIFKETGRAIRALFQGGTPADQRREMIQQLRAKSSQRIGLLLNPDQLKKYQQMRAEAKLGGNQRGQVWRLGDGGGTQAGAPQAVNVVSGISDGTVSEIVSGDLAEGDQIIIGIASQAGR